MNSVEQPNNIYDLLVVGGGVNGCGIANDASGRGLTVFLCEQFDLASETSSRSTKMVHGGLRYLEYYEFRLVREALSEREVMLNIAPHIVQPLQLIIPHNSLQRPAWMVRLGLFLYDHLGFKFGRKSKIPGSYGLQLNSSTPVAEPLLAELKKGFCYYDCKVDDARLVALNAVAAKINGAQVYTRTKFIGAEKHNGLWISTLEDQHTGQQYQIKSKTLVNAAGPWVDQIVNQTLNIKTKHQIELVKGSHIVIPKFYEGEQAYLLQNKDKRVIFVIPYHNDFTMIGTTDIPYHDDPATVTIDDTERDYLCEVVNRYFKQKISPADIVNEWSGVRPLQADEANNPSAVTRDYSLEVEDDAGATPVLSIFGGKITTYRELAKHAMQKLSSYLPHMGPEWTATTPLPGGDITSAADYSRQLQKKYPFLPCELLQRYAFSYGSLSEKILNDVSSIETLGQDFGNTLFAKEVDYLIDNEWAQTCDDILWRRTKLGLRNVNTRALEQYVKSARA
jgi:glycerol-3-phosphate dehydrogenase